MGKVKKFTLQEIEAIRSLYLTHSASEIAKMLSRSSFSIRNKAVSLGLKHDEKTKKRLKEKCLNNLLTRKENWRELLSAKRKQIFKAEIRRVIMSQKRKTKLRILFVPHKTARAMQALKYEYNYFCNDYNELVLYYDNNTKRTKNEHYFTIKYGIKFKCAI